MAVGSSAIQAVCSVHLACLQSSVLGHSGHPVAATEPGRIILFRSSPEAASEWCSVEPVGSALALRILAGLGPGQRFESMHWLEAEEHQEDREQWPRSPTVIHSHSTSAESSC